MKKILAFILVLVMTLSLCSCGSDEDPDKLAFDTSKQAFENIDKAYAIVNEYSSVIYEAWYEGVNNKFELCYEEDTGTLAYRIGVSEEDVQLAIAKLLEKSEYTYGDWEALQSLYPNSFFSACVDVASESYVVNGKVDEVTELLTEAKEIMKKMSDDYSDYEHYPSLKEYFTNTLAFFDFCRNPEGSFEQVVETFKDYRNNAREYFFDLNYVFDDSIGGMNEGEDEDETV